MIERLKARWGTTSTWQFTVIMLVFAVTGFSILYVKTPVYNLLNIPLDTNRWLCLPLIVICYQVLLLFWGTVFGQFRFFWEKEKKVTRFFFVWLIPIWLTGCTTLLMKEPVFRLLGIPTGAHDGVHALLTAITFPVLLLAWGAVFGQFHRFWAFEKKIGRKLFGWMPAGQKA